MYLNLNYTDFEEFIQGMTGWDIDARKLDKGEFTGNLSIINTQFVQLVKFRFTGAMDRYGSTPLGYMSFVIPGSTNQNYQWFNKQLDSSIITKFPESRELDMFSKGDFSSIGLNIETNHLRQLIEHYKFINVDRLLESKEQAYQFTEYQVMYMANCVHQLYAQASRNPSLLSDINFLHKVNIKLPYVLLELLEHANLKVTNKKQSKSERALQSSVSYINKNLSRKISMAELCKYANVSERTLENAFKLRYEISPKNYIDRTKLCLINRELSKPYGQDNISTIASQFGIKHKGQFAKDYYNYFNELPSDTRRNQRELL